MMCIEILLNFAKDGEEVAPYGSMKNDFNPS